MNKYLWVGLVVAAGSLSMGCGDDGSDGVGGSTGTGSQTCDSAHTCINDVCECDTEGKAGTPCTDNDLCEAECEVCTTS